jgi:hypothetical protein
MIEALRRTLNAMATELPEALDADLFGGYCGMLLGIGEEIGCGQEARIIVERLVATYQDELLSAATTIDAQIHDILQRLQERNQDHDPR